MSYSWWTLLLSSWPSRPCCHKGLHPGSPRTTLLLCSPCTRQDMLAGLGNFHMLPGPAGCLRHSPLSEALADWAEEKGGREEWRQREGEVRKGQVLSKDGGWPVKLYLVLTPWAFVTSVWTHGICQSRLSPGHPGTVGRGLRELGKILWLHQEAWLNLCGCFYSRR